MMRRILLIFIAGLIVTSCASTQHTLQKNQTKAQIKQTKRYSPDIIAKLDRAIVVKEKRSTKEAENKTNPDDRANLLETKNTITAINKNSHITSTHKSNDQQIQASERHLEKGVTTEDGNTVPDRLIVKEKE